MQIKNQVRASLKAQRKNIINKIEKDNQIIKNLTDLPAYQNAKTVLFYVSLPDEISTDNGIKSAIRNGKTVAVPYCVDKNGKMEYYIINSIDDLVVGSFNIREPNINNCTKLTDFADSVCIVPALAFDETGYRIGYGKGYYDRFLENYPFISIGLCYNSFVQKQIPVQSHDKAVEFVVTEKGIITCKNGGKYGQY